MPHSSDEDDEYNGYFIPKGTVLLGNVYAIQMDPTRYPDPHVFRPERFYTPSQPTMWRDGPESKDRDIYVFGWGRRYCPGAYLAEGSIFMACARIIWGLDLTSPAHPTTGEPTLPGLNDEKLWTSDPMIVPKIFPVVWQARNTQREEVIKRAFEDAQREWQLLGLEQDAR